MGAAAIVPVFNEGHRMHEVLNAVRECSVVDEVVVVDDGSNDVTSDILAGMSGLTVLTHKVNQGKGEALDAGMAHIIRQGHDNVVFLDGDLKGVNASHVDQLLRPLGEDSYMSIGYLGLRKAIFEKVVLDNWGALSGQRALRTEAWSLLTSDDKHGFNIEAALNARFRKAGLHRTISRIALDGVSHTGKRKKEGSWPRALTGYSATYSAAFLTYARIELESLTS